MSANDGSDMYEALSSTGHMLRRFLDRLVSVPVTNERGQIVNRFAAAQIPDWEIRQQLEDIDAALVKARGGKV